ncbi:hypothetical protein [Terrimonas pollutisoli]|uniref:hypothetical protein n=1 Tax=Terrimonas pollutisoli TaxID=3034147 RepID=UPI0023EAF293|nr:hypothetical protein [Terrimonas sp. H1YJ31]
MILKEFIFFGHNAKIKGASITPEKIDETVIQLKQKGIQHLTIVNWAKEASLNFLINQSWIKSLHLSIENIDITVVNTLKNLEYFECNYNNVKGAIDLVNFPNLKQLRIIHSTILYSNFEKLNNLQYLEVNRWPDEDLEGLKNLKKLEWVELNFAKKLVSLKGIHYLKELSFLKFYSATKLEDISELKTIASSLSKLSFELVPKIKDFNVLNCLPNLERFYIFRSAPLSSVQFIKHLKNLKYAYIGTEVLDGDIKILKMKNIEYKKSKRYK